MPATLSPVLKQATAVQVRSGHGVYVTDVDGRDYLDFTAGIGVTSTGHCHPRVVDAAQRQVASLIHGQYTTVMHQPLRELLAKLGEVLPAGLDSVFLANSGSEAVEASLRLARQATRRPNVVTFHGGFHGRTRCRDHRRPPAGRDTSPPGGNTIRHREPSVVLPGCPVPPVQLVRSNHPRAQCNHVGRSMNWTSNRSFRS